MVIVLLLSLAAAVCFAGGYVLQYHEAHDAPASLMLSARLLLELVRHKIWLAGIAAMVLGDVLQAVALGRGSLAVVEPILTTSLLFALPLSAMWRRERLQRSEWVGALMVSAGLGVLLGVGSPTLGNTTMNGFHWFLVVAACLGATFFMVSAGRRSPWPAPRAALIGGAAAVLFGLQDVLTRFCLHVLSNDPGQLFLQWQTYLLLLAGFYGLALMQSAYKAGPLTAGLPPIAVGEPLVGMLIGVFALNEQLDASTVALVFETVGAAIMVAGTWVLGRSPLVCGAQHPSRLRRVEALLMHEVSQLHSPPRVTEGHR